MQLIGTNIFKDGDMYIGALRYAQLPTSKQYVLDLNTMYPLTNDWLLSPRLRLGYEVDNASGLKQYTVLPSFPVDYQLTPDLNFELEVGAQWTRSVQPAAAAVCRYSARTDSSNCVSRALASP